MFYLELTFKKIFKHPFRAISFILLTVTMICFVSYWDYLKQKVVQYSKIEEQGPSFHALVKSAENAHWIARKVKEIPGVMAVNVIEKEKIALEARNTLKDVLEGQVAESKPADKNSDEPTEKLLDSSYYGLKVVCDKNTTDRALNLLREYVVRLAGGPSNIILGKVTEINKNLKTQSPLHLFMKKEMVPIGLLILFIFWLISFFSFEARMREAAYLIEKFQRRRRVAFKTFLVITTLIVSFSMIPFIFFEQFNILNYLLITSFLVLTCFLELRKGKWLK